MKILKLVCCLAPLVGSNPKPARMLNQHEEDVKTVEELIEEFKAAGGATKDMLESSTALASYEFSAITAATANEINLEGAFTWYVSPTGVNFFAVTLDLRAVEEYFKSGSYNYVYFQIEKPVFEHLEDSEEHDHRRLDEADGVEEVFFEHSADNMHDHVHELEGEEYVTGTGEYQGYGIIVKGALETSKDDLLDFLYHYDYWGTTKVNSRMERFFPYILLDDAIKNPKNSVWKFPKKQNILIHPGPRERIKNYVIHFQGWRFCDEEEGPKRPNFAIKKNVDYTFFAGYRYYKPGSRSTALANQQGDSKMMQFRFDSAVMTTTFSVLQVSSVVIFAVFCGLAYQTE